MKFYTHTIMEIFITNYLYANYRKKAEDFDLSMDEAIKSFKNNKSGWPRRIILEMINYGSPELFWIIHHMF